MRQHSEATLAELPSVQGFRQRGLDMTRVEAFTDAAFAFSLTLLVISFDELPGTFAEFIEALKRIPTFAACFAQIAIFWYAHHRWSRRYGLDDLTTALLSLTLVFVTLIFVFPLRIIFSAMFAWMTQGWVPFELADFSPSEMGTIFVIYGAGFTAMCAVISGLYWHAGRRADQLILNAEELFTTHSETQAWLLMGSVGMLSIAWATLAPADLKPFAGFAYSLLAVIMPAFGAIKGRQFQR